MQQAAAAGAQLRPLHALQPLQGGQLRGVHARQVLQPQRNRLSPAAAAAAATVAAAANVLFRRRLSVRLRGCLPGIWGGLRRRCGNVRRRPAGAGPVDQRAGTGEEQAQVSTSPQQSHHDFTSAFSVLIQE